MIDDIVSFSNRCKIEGIECDLFRGYRRKDKEISRSYNEILNGTADVFKEAKPVSPLPPKESLRLYIISDSNFLPTIEEFVSVQSAVKTLKEREFFKYRYCEWVILSDSQNNNERALGSYEVSLLLKKELDAIRCQIGSPFDDYVTAQKILLEKMLEYFSEFPNRDSLRGCEKRIKTVLGKPLN